MLEGPSPGEPRHSPAWLLVMAVGCVPCTFSLVAGFGGVTLAAVATLHGWGLAAAAFALLAAAGVVGAVVLSRTKRGCRP